MYQNIGYFYLQHNHLLITFLPIYISSVRKYKINMFIIISLLMLSSYVLELLVIFIVYFLLYINFTYTYNVICYAMVHVTWRLCLIISMDTCNNNITPSVKLHNYYFHFICLTFTSSLFKLTNPFS